MEKKIRKRIYVRTHVKQTRETGGKRKKKRKLGKKKYIYIETKEIEKMVETNGITHLSKFDCHNHMSFE